KSLVTVVDVEQNEEARYRLLEPLRQYAFEKLQTHGEMETYLLRHLGWAMNFAEQLEPTLKGAAQVTGFAHLEMEHDNLRAALQYALQSQRVEPGLRLAGALERFWEARGHFTEGQGWVKQLLALDGTEGSNLSLRAQALFVQGILAYRQN